MEYPNSHWQKPKKKEDTSLFFFSKAVLLTLDKFIASSDEVMAEKHVPERVRVRSNGSREERENYEVHVHVCVYVCTYIVCACAVQLHVCMCVWLYMYKEAMVLPL